VLFKIRRRPGSHRWIRRDEGIAHQIDPSGNIPRAFKRADFDPGHCNALRWCGEQAAELLDVHRVAQGVSMIALT